MKFFVSTDDFVILKLNDVIDINGIPKKGLAEWIEQVIPVKQNLSSAWMPKRICSTCNRPIYGGHKWQFGEDGRPHHRNCDKPESYPEVPK